MIKYTKLIYLMIIPFIQACSSVPAAPTQQEKSSGVLVYRQNVFAGVAASIEIDFNGQPHKIQSGGSVLLKPIVGLNRLTKIRAIGAFHDEPMPDRFILREEPIYFEYAQGESVRIGIATAQPAIFQKFDSKGVLTSNNALSYGEARHTIHAYPNNVKIFFINDDGSKRELYNNSASKDWDRMASFPLTLNLLTNEPKIINTIIRWDDFDHEIKYNFTMIKRQTTEEKVLPEASERFHFWKSNTLSGSEKIKYICEKGMHSTHKDPNKCIEYETALQADREKIAKEIALQKEVSEKLQTDEGSRCKGKINPKRTDRYEEFFECFVNEQKKKQSAVKYANALKTKEGQYCAATQKRDNAEFWKCHEERLEISKIISNDQVAGQCISIGFEYGGKDYKDCYLKLKIHIEQIAAWKKLQESLESRKNEQVARAPLGSNDATKNDLDQAARYLDLAQRGFESAAGGSRLVQPTTLPPPPVRIITPRGSSYNCSMMGAALRCR
jgi:hypothetical protein